MATITTRVDDTLKREAQRLAKELGINLSTLVTVRMKEFVRNKRLSVGLSEDHYDYYVNNPDYIQVDEPLESFHSYLTALVKKDEQSAGKVS